MGTRTTTTRLPRAHTAESLSAIEADEWDALVAPGSGPLRHAALRAWERCELAELQSRPLVIRGRDGELLAAAPAYHYDLDTVSINQSAVTRILQATRRVAPRLLMLRVYELGSAAPLMPPFLHGPDVDREAAARQLLEAALREVEDEHGDLLVVQDFRREDSPLAPLFEELGFSSIPMHPTIVVDLPFSSFEEYAGAMRSNYRRRLKTVGKRSAHLAPELVRDFAPLAEELSRLWRLVYERATEYRRELLPPRYFEAVAEDDATSVLLMRRPDNSIASFALLVDDDPVLHFLSTGFAEAAGIDEGAYFRLLYEIVRVGIEGGFRSVNLGMTTAEPKLDVGGVAVPLAAWVHHRNGLLQRSFAYLGSGPFGPDDPEPRRVFKDSM